MRGAPTCVNVSFLDVEISLLSTFQSGTTLAARKNAENLNATNRNKSVCLIAVMIIHDKLILVLIKTKTTERKGYVNFKAAALLTNLSLKILFEFSTNFCEMPTYFIQGPPW